MYNRCNVQRSTVTFAICSFGISLFSTLIRDSIVETDSISNVSTVVLDGS